MPSVLSLLTDPDEFFRRQGSDPSLKGPLVVILAVVAVDVVAAVLQSRFTSQLFEGVGAGAGSWRSSRRSRTCSSSPGRS
ncbi:hypothetical protein [Halosimplex pelagicum]|uniref:Uncharacterized protein n=1 Tax=Halosimplex pelagicum TaxID=869886 RepID=A0A7D5PDJ5_9EURY|nr:hypothetical protein [Halosimplex pelagicum]QLH84222.1 hypothetical protein HZS54_22420 [Halosimplex pelagicum]